MLSEGPIRVNMEGTEWREVKQWVLAVGGMTRAEEGDKFWVRDRRPAQEH